MKKYRIFETAALAAAFTCALALGTAAQDVENAHLTVTVPDEIAAICDIEANDDAAVKEFDRIASIDEFIVRHLVLNIEK